MSGGRRARVDVLRGLALGVIYWSHAMMMASQTSVFLLFTPIFTSYSDAAEVFVFLAGLSFGHSYAEQVATRGLGAALWRALRRSAQLYRAQILTFFTMMGALIAIQQRGGAIPAAVLSFFEDPLSATTAAVALVYLPTSFDLLPLYMLLLPYGVLLLAMRRRHPWLPLILGVSLYLLAWADPALTLPRYQPLHGSDGRWFLNPLAWQLPFCVGLTLARRERPFTPPPRLARALDLAALVIALGAPILKFGTAILIFRPDLSDLDWGREALALRPGVLFGTNKTLLHPVRLVNFAAWVWLVARKLPEEAAIWRCAPARLLALLGRHSLPVFCLSSALVYLIVASWAPRGGTASLLGLLALGALVCLGATALSDRDRPKP